MKNKLVRLHWFFATQIGIDIFLFFGAIRSAPRFIFDLVRFRSQYSGKIKLRPCLHDRSEAAGSVENEYFIQDLCVAQLVNEKNPSRHLDIGSRVDGFVAHVASFRQIEVMDVRPLVASSDRIQFLQHDLMDPVVDNEAVTSSSFDSISCLHALEHFGLGRYGDPIDPFGWVKGLENICDLLQTGGRLYLSTLRP